MKYRFPLNRIVDLSLSGTYSGTVHRYVPGRLRQDGEGQPPLAGHRKPINLASNELTVEVRETLVSSR